MRREPLAEISGSCAAPERNEHHLDQDHPACKKTDEDRRHNGECSRQHESSIHISPALATNDC